MSKTRTITPNPPADFTPEMGSYKTLQPFRYWCQKVLPLVYDDSLSYYELLCKVVDYLNKTMEDVETLHGDVDNLHTAYEQLQEYVNNYFSSLDVQEEINNKLDAMVESGELDVIIARVVDHLIDYVTPELYGALGDGETDDTESLQKAINDAVEKGVQLRGSSGKTYKITSNITVNGTLNWNGNNCKLLLINSSLLFETDTRIEYSIIENIRIDSNHNPNIVCHFNNLSRSYISNITIENLSSIGFQFDGDCFENVVTTIRLINVNGDNKNKGFIVNSTDIYFEYLFGQDIHTFIENNAAGNIFTNCHAWLYQRNVLLNSIFMKASVSCEVIGCVVDTYETGFSIKEYLSMVITGCRCIINPLFYNSELTTVKSTFIKIAGDDLGSNMRVSNCWVSFTDEKGYFTNKPDFTRIKLSNNFTRNILDKLYNNTYYTNDSILGKAEKFRLQNNNTMVSLSCYLLYTEKGNNKIGTLPKGFAPSYDKYCIAVALDNTTNQYESCYVYIAINGDVYLNTTNISIPFNSIIIDTTFFL